MVPGPGVKVRQFGRIASRSFLSLPILENVQQEFRESPGLACKLPVGFSWLVLQRVFWMPLPTRTGRFVRGKHAQEW